MTDDEFEVLDFLDGIGSEAAAGFLAIRLPRERARAACRGLRARGLVKFYRGLLDEDGWAAGSGYGITARGQQLVKAARVLRYWHPFCECRQNPWREPLWMDPRLAFSDRSDAPAPPAPGP